MTGSIPQKDHRGDAVEALPELLKQDLDHCQGGALLWTAKRPRKGWFKGLTTWTPLVFSSGPLFEQILWLRPDLAVAPPAEFSQQCERLLSDYKELFRKTTPVEQCPDWISYRTLLQNHIAEQEQDHYRQLEKRLPVARALRELEYEHRGLEKGLLRFPAILEASRSGRLTSRERELFDLDFYHLLEHHLEREANAIYPIISLTKG